MFVRTGYALRNATRGVIGSGGHQLPWVYLLPGAHNYLLMSEDTGVAPDVTPILKVNEALERWAKERPHNPSFASLYISCKAVQEQDWDTALSHLERVDRDVVAAKILQAAIVLMSQHNKNAAQVILQPYSPDSGFFTRVADINMIANINYWSLGIHNNDSHAQDRLDLHLELGKTCQSRTQSVAALHLGYLEEHPVRQRILFDMAADGFSNNGEEELLKLCQSVIANLEEEADEQKSLAM